MGNASNPLHNIHMDSAQMPTTKSDALDMLWRRLSEANSDINITQSHIREAQTMHFWIRLLRAEEVSFEFIQPLLTSCAEHLKRLREHEAQLGERRDNIRLAINEQTRPLLRPLTVLDLPNETLRSIFEYVKGETTMFELDFFDMGRGDVAQVKNLRLTCRRFCDNSSHLLMFYVKVDMTPQSISHLNEVSQHPTISKGIRAVQIPLGRHFDANIANDFQDFAHYQASRLREHVEGWEMNIARPLGFDKTPKDVYERAVEQASTIAASWEDAAQFGVDEDCSEHVLLKIAQKEYQRCYESQVLLQRGAFGQAVATAMKRMPTATWLDLTDEDLYSRGPERMLSNFFPRDLEDPALLQLKLQAPEFSWSMARYKGLRSPPIDTIPSILASVGEARICLKGVDIRMPLPDDLSSFSMAEAEHPKLRAASQQLRAFEFRPRHATPLSLDTSYLLSGFLSTILDTRTLQKIDLCFDFQYENGEHIPPTFSMASVLLSRHWPELKALTYNGPFYFEEMQKVINRIGKDVDLQWSGYSMDESWAKVLDFLRGRVSHNARLGDVNGSIAGAECEEMTTEERDFIFREDLESFSGSLATKFIRGWTDTNPVKDWENGELMIPEVMIEDGDDGDDGSVADE